MGKGIKFTVAMGILALFGCIQLGCEQPGVKKEAAASPQAEEKAVAAKQPEASAPEVQKEETASHPTDKRAIQQIISDITGGKIGADNSGDLYSGGLTATYTSPEETMPGEGKFGKLFKFLPLIRWYDPDHYYTPNMNVSGEFKHEECIMCHTVQTPGIVAQWKRASMPQQKRVLWDVINVTGTITSSYTCLHGSIVVSVILNSRQDTAVARLDRIPTHFM